MTKVGAPFFHNSVQVVNDREILIDSDEIEVPLLL